MSIDINFHNVEPYRSIHTQVHHMADLDCVTVRAHDDLGNHVVLYFKADGDVDELTAAENWLIDALDRVHAARCDADGACRQLDPEGDYICTLEYGHSGQHEAYGPVELYAAWANSADARIGEPDDLTAVQS